MFSWVFSGVLAQAHQRASHLESVCFDFGVFPSCVKSSYEGYFTVLMNDSTLTLVYINAPYALHRRVPVRMAQP